MGKYTIEYKTITHGTTVVEADTAAEAVARWAEAWQIVCDSDHNNDLVAVVNGVHPLETHF